MGLDVIEDNGPRDDRMGKVIQTIINAISILIGFAWEHSFDGGVEAVASVTLHPVSMKLALTVLVAVIIIPMWRRHILVKVGILRTLKELRTKSQRKPRVDDEEGYPLTSRTDSTNGSDSARSNYTPRCCGA